MDWNNRRIFKYLKKPSYVRDELYSFSFYDHIYIYIYIPNNIIQVAPILS